MSNNLRSKPVTYDDVAQVLMTLQTEGLPHSVRLVHARLGRGSLSTINKFMQQIQRGTLAPASDLDALKATIQGFSMQLINAVDAFAVQAGAQERTLVEAMRESFEHDIAGYQREKELALAQLQSETKQNAELGGALTDLKLSLHNAQSKYEGAVLELSTLRVENHTLTERLSSSNEQFTALKHEYSAYRARGRAADGDASKLIALEAELAQIRRNELQLTQMVGSLTNKLTQAEHQLSLERSCTNAAEAKRDELQALVGELSVIQLADKSLVQSTQAQYHAALAQFDEAKQKNLHLADQLNRLQARLIDEQAAEQQRRYSEQQQNRSVTVGLVEHSKRLFTLLQQHTSTQARDEDVKELEIAQREIEKLFYRQGL